MNTPAYYKLVRRDGRDFEDSGVLWVPDDGVPEGGLLIEHPDPDCLLTAVDTPSDTDGMQWPCRVLELQPVDGEDVTHLGGRFQTKDPERRSNVYGSRAWRVVREQPAHLALGYNGQRVARFIDRALALTDAEIDRLKSAHDDLVYAEEVSGRLGEVRAHVVYRFRLLAHHALLGPALAAARTAAGQRLAVRSEREPDLDLSGVERLMFEALLATMASRIQSDRLAELAQPWVDVVGE